VNEVSNERNRNTVTAEIMSNDTKFAQVIEKEMEKKRKPFHTLDRVLRAAKKIE